MDDHCHITQPLLPWLVNGTLSSEETVSTLNHVRRCSTCRQDLALLSAASKAMHADCCVPDADFVQALWSRLELSPPAQSMAHVSLRDRAAATATAFRRGVAPLMLLRDATAITYRGVAWGLRQVLAETPSS